MSKGYTDHSTISSIRYCAPKLSLVGEKFSLDKVWVPTIDAENIAYHSLFKPFNLNQYLYPRPPIDMGLVDLPSKHLNVLRMPIKYPGTNYCIPKELSHLVPLIKRCAQYEMSINNEHNEYFCHITYDFSVVKKNEYHRYPGFHGDGIQGAKLTPKVNIEHSYIVTTAPPTEFCLQPFFLKHLDESKHNYFMEFDKQAHDANIYGSLPNHLYLIDPYMVHRTPKIKKATDRLFIRITYASTELEHPKNTLNPMFRGQEYIKRVDIRENLTRHEFEPPYHLYGLTKV